MVHAYIMVKTGAGESEQLLDPIHGLPGVVDAHIVAGAFDIIVEVETPNVYDVLKAASSGIQGLHGVTGTKTYIAIDE